jgi:hypothetical protein
MRKMISIARRRPGAPLAGAPPAAALDRIRWGVLGLAVAAGLALATGADAADIPSSTRSTVALFFANNSLATRQHAFETAKDSDWFRVSLKGGVDYYITGLYGDQGDDSVLQSTFRDAAGNILVQALFFDPFTADGYEIRAPRDGTYFIELRTTSSVAGKVYAARLGGDCRRGIITKCTMQPGQVRDNNVLGGAHDWDSFKLALTTGRTYTLFVGSKQGCASGLTVDMMDSTGKLIAFGQPFSAAGYDYAAQLVFRAPKTGMFFATVSASDDCQVLYRFRMR